MDLGVLGWGSRGGRSGGGRRALGDDHRYVRLCNDADGAWGGREAAAPLLQSLSRLPDAREGILL